MKNIYNNTKPRKNHTASSKWKLLFDEWWIFTGRMVWFKEHEQVPIRHYIQHAHHWTSVHYTNIDSEFYRCMHCFKKVPDEVKFVVKLMLL